jgi:hypothetical protein
MPPMDDVGSISYGELAELETELCDAYENGVSEVFSLACESELIAFCGDPATFSPLDMDARYSVAGYGGVAFYLERRIDNETVAAIMVGDDREHVVSVDDLTAIGEDDYCHECGQVGCTADGRERGEEE